MAKWGSIGREIFYLIFFVGLVVAALPTLIVLSVALFQSLSEGWESALEFLQALGDGLLAGSFGSWALLLGPYALFLALRGLRGAWRFYREKTRTRRIERAH